MIWRFLSSYRRLKLIFSLTRQSESGDPYVFSSLPNVLRSDRLLNCVQGAALTARTTLRACSGEPAVCLRALPGAPFESTLRCQRKRDTRGVPVRSRGRWIRRLASRPGRGSDSPPGCHSLPRPSNPPSDANEKETRKVSLFRWMGEGGFEPPKAVPADLQSVPFGHSGIPPYEAAAHLRGLRSSW